MDNSIVDLIALLMEKQVPSISPKTGMSLAAVFDALKGIENPSPALTAYKRSLQFVITISALHQAAVIAGLETLLKKEGAI